ncbi:Pex19 protein [Melanogaster broomeanus]|nr:Pex19 protein [Melanogaster broomeanus]
MSSSQEPRVDEEEDLDDLDGQDDDLANDFNAELAREMESLFKGLLPDPQSASGSVGPGSGDQNETAEAKAERERAFTAAWEAMLIEGMDGMMSESSNAGAPASSRSPKPKEDDDFQSRIRSTMNKLKESESGLKTSPAGADTFESLLSQLEGMGDLNEAPESEEQLQGVLEAMMGQLMSKDILYEPLKELYDKFPGYLTEHSGTISPEDKKRFDAQIICIKQVLDVFASKDYRDEDAKTREKIVELMGELQTHGSPPEEIMGPLPPGFNMGTDGLPNVPENCVIG